MIGDSKKLLCCRLKPGDQEVEAMDNSKGDCGESCKTIGNKHHSWGEAVNRDATDRQHLCMNGRN